MRDLDCLRGSQRGCHAAPGSDPASPGENPNLLPGYHSCQSIILYRSESFLLEPERERRRTVPREQDNRQQLGRWWTEPWGCRSTWPQTGLGYLQGLRGAMI